MTSAVPDQNEPSESSATAVTVCVSARRTRVDMRARPARGQENAHHVRLRVLLRHDVDALT